MLKGRKILPVLMVAVLISTQVQAENILSLEDAYQSVLDTNPQVQSHIASIESVSGNYTQQSLSPNPEIVFEVENFGGNGTLSGFDGAEYTLGFEQEIEVAGKRSKRERVADLEVQYVAQKALASVQSTLAQTKKAYIDVAIAQKMVTLAKNRVSLTNKTHEIVKKRMNVGKAADITAAEYDIAAGLLIAQEAGTDINRFDYERDQKPYTALIVTKNKHALGVLNNQIQQSLTKGKVKGLALR